MTTDWIDISDFAEKYGISESTLRRRIRSKTILWKMEKGKYLLKDSGEAFEMAPLYARLRQKSPLEDPLAQENRRLKGQISELETLVKALEAELASRG